MKFDIALCHSQSISFVSYNEKFENNATLIIEASTADTKKKSDVFFKYLTILPALQFLHLPPMGDKGISSDDKADDVTDHDDTNHKVEVKKL